MRDLITIEKVDQQGIHSPSGAGQITAWQRRAQIYFSALAKRVARKRLELELTHYRRVADTLVKQIDNDTEALAHVNARLALIYSQWATFGK
jgi:hypothetical protein